MKKITGFVTKVFYVENTVNRNNYNTKNFLITYLKICLEITTKVHIFLSIYSFFLEKAVYVTCLLRNYSNLP